MPPGRRRKSTKKFLHNTRWRCTCDVNFSLLHLPDEIMNGILANDFISVEDLGRLSNTCWYLNGLVENDNCLWRAKFFQRWPGMCELYTRRMKESIDFRRHVWISLNCRKKMLAHLGTMSSMHFLKDDLTSSDLKYFNTLCEEEKEYSVGYQFIVDEMLTLFDQKVCDFTLTDRYYARKVLTYIKRYYLSIEWKTFANANCNEHTFDRIAHFVSNWFQPLKRLMYSEISSVLDKMARDTIHELRIQNPRHSIHRVAAEQLEYWQSHNIQENYYDRGETEEIVRALNRLFYIQMEYTAPTEETRSWKNVLIDWAMDRRCAIPRLFAIIYASVARRLGVHCVILEPIQLLVYCKIIDPKQRTVDCIEIDVSNGGLTKVTIDKNIPFTSCSRKDCDEVHNMPLSQLAKLLAADVSAVLSRRNFNNATFIRPPESIRSVLEFRILCDPADLPAIKELCQYYQARNMPCDEILVKIKEAQQYHNSHHVYELFRWNVRRILKAVKVAEFPAPKPYQPNVKYVVGTLITYHRNGLAYNCVITGWDIVERTAQQSRRRETVAAAPRNTRNTAEFYVSYELMDEGGRIHNTIAEWLEVTLPVRPLVQYKIGRYFLYFNGRYYVPNEQLSKIYPDDERIHQQRQLESKA